jgi:hypothetical protein
MAIPEDLALLEQQLGSLIIRYEQYFSGLEKREPLKLLEEVDRIVRRYATITINNTMYKHKYNMLTARFNTYREHWNRILRQIEEGKYSRDRFISELHQRQKLTRKGNGGQNVQRSHHDVELDRIYNEFVEARKACNLPVDRLNREMVVSTIEKSKPALVARLGTDNLAFRVVVEDGKPKIKASLRK